MANWLDTLLDRGNEAKQSAAQQPAIVKQATPREPKPEIKEVWFQTRAPVPERGDSGNAEAAFYSVSDGLLRMHDANGKPTGNVHRLAPEDDPRRVAGRLGHAAWVSAKGHSDFNRPLNYQPQGLC